jgi:hypothetical protein
MMIYLDLPQSRREHPNENWARELMELFTVGIGNYTEQDVRESARAFTGYRLDLATQRFRFAPNQHDAGAKNFQGRAGNFNGDDIIDILTKQPACAEFIGRKICRYFIEDEPSVQLVNLVAERMRAHNFEMKPLFWGRAQDGGAQKFDENGAVFPRDGLDSFKTRAISLEGINRRRRQAAKRRRNILSATHRCGSGKHTDRGKLNLFVARKNAQ